MTGRAGLVSAESAFRGRCRHRHERLEPLAPTEPLRRIDALLRPGGGPSCPDPSAKTPGADEEVAAVLEPLHARAEELRRISRELQKVSLELNYRSAGTSEVTLRDLRGLATRLDALSKELTRTSGWFEG
jgi:hypothetical protein